MKKCAFDLNVVVMVMASDVLNGLESTNKTLVCVCLRVSFFKRRL